MTKRRKRDRYDIEAEKIANELFTSGGGEMAATLRLVDSAGRDLGGWAYKSLVDEIATVLRRKEHDQRR